jgi:hypothetical protein
VMVAAIRGELAGGGTTGRATALGISAHGRHHRPLFPVRAHVATRLPPHRCGLVDVRYAAIATKLYIVTKCRDVPQADSCVAAIASYSITSSARTRNESGIVSPIALAAARLTTSLKVAGACTGRSAGEAPFKIRSTYDAARRNTVIVSRP